MLNPRAAPTAFFTYNQPRHTADALALLATCRVAAESDIVIFSDAANEEKDAAAVQAVRNVIDGRRVFVPWKSSKDGQTSAPPSRSWTASRQC